MDIIKRYEAHFWASGLSLLLVFSITFYSNAETMNFATLQSLKDKSVPSKDSLASLIAIHSEEIKKKENSNSYIKRALLHLQLKHHDKALSDINKSIKLSRRNGDNYYVRGMIEFDQQDLDAALKDFSKAIKYKTQFSEVYRHRASIYVVNRDYHNALPDLNKAINLNPNEYLSLVQRAFIYKQQKKYSSAVEDLDNAISLKDNAIFPYNLRAILHCNLGNWEDAAKDFGSAINCGDSSAATFNNRAYSYVMTGENLELALNDVNYALSKSSDISFYDTRVELYLKLQENEMAKQDMRTIIQSLKGKEPETTKYMKMLKDMQ